MTPRKWVRAAGLIIVAFALFDLVARLFLQAYVVAHPHRWVAELTEQETGQLVERLTFRTADGVELVGWFVPGHGDGATIVVSHGSGANGPGTYPGVAFLQRAGYNVFVFDHRAHGQSGGRATTLGPREAKDVSAAVALVASRPDVDEARIAVMGCSMGSAAGIGAAAADPAIRAVVAESVYADQGELWSRFGYVGIRGTSIHWSWGAPLRWATWLWTGHWPPAFKPEALVGRIAPRPLLLIHGELDNAACTVADARRLYQAAGEPKELWIAPGAGHCSAHSTLPEAYERRILDFLGRALTPPP